MDMFKTQYPLLYNTLKKTYKHVRTLKRTKEYNADKSGFEKCFGGCSFLNFINREIGLII